MNLTFSDNGRYPTHKRTLASDYTLKSCNGRVTAHKDLSPDFGIRFEALNIREERTGIHAKVGIYMTHANGAKLLAWNNFNVERSEDRTRLSNSAFDILKHTSETAAGFIEKLALKNHLDIYAAGLWSDYLAPLAAEKVVGNLAQTEQVFLAKSHVLQGGGTIMFAPPGRGKSITAMLIAVSVDSGASTIWPTEMANTMIINLERSAQSFQRRLGSVNKALGLDADRPLVILNARGKSLTQVADIAAVSIQQHEIGFVVLDSISRAGHGDLTENKPVNAIIDALNGIAETWLALAHTPRADESHIFGGIHFDAGADIVVKLLTDQSDDRLGIGLQVVKANDLPPQPMMVLDYGFNEFGLTSAKLSRVSEFPGLIETQGVKTVDAISEYLMNEVRSASATDIAKELKMNRSQVANILSKDKRFIRLTQQGKSVLYGVKGSYD